MPYTPQVKDQPDYDLTKSDFALMVVIGIAFGAISYGIHGTVSAAAIGFGAGLLVLPVLVLLLILFVYFF